MKSMVTVRQKKILTRFLALSPDPEETFNYDELMGYLFGIAITPDVILPSEWMDQIFGRKQPVYDSTEQTQEMLGCLMQVYTAFVDASRSENLRLPFNILALKPGQYDAVFAWVFGLNVALSLRPDIWEPEATPGLPEDLVFEVMASLNILEGLLDPEISAAYFEALPADILREAFGDFEADDDDIESRQLAILLSSLPMVVETLQEYARMINAGRRPKIPRKSNLIPFRSTTIAGNEPCQCNSKQKCTKRSGQDGNITAISPPEKGRKAKKGQVIRGRFPGPAKKAAEQGPIYQLKVSLSGARPPIWRRIQVPGATTLADLHSIIQLCMGWKDRHLHHFNICGELYALPDEEEAWYPEERRDERTVTLDTLGARLQPSFRYVYDMGDYWEHKIEVEKILPQAESPSPVTLMTGRRACPPEDCGGIPGYAQQLKILENPAHPDFKQTRRWFGTNFHPDDFNRDEIMRINKRLQRRF